MLGSFASRMLDTAHDAPAARAARPAEPPAPAVAVERPAPKAAANTAPNAAPNTAPKTEPAAPPAEPAVKPEMISSIGSGMSITGNIVCEGPMQVYGRIEGELRATEIHIGDSAQVEGNVMAQDLIIRGRVKGTVRAVRVKLQGHGSVEGDILHRSLSIEEQALFEGTSRRVENPVETGAETRPSGAQVRSLLRPSLQALGDLSPDTSAA